MQKLNLNVADLSKYRREIADEARRIKSPSHFAIDTESAMRDRAVAGLTLPWSKTHHEVRLRESELTVVVGKNGSGKSLLLGQILLSLVPQGAIACDLSLEMPPYRTLYRLVRQACGSSDPSPEFVKKFNEWTDPVLYLYDRAGTVAPQTMLALARYTRYELGVTDFVIDSLMKCGIAPDDLAAQTRFADQLQTHCRDTGQRVFLVVHPRKSSGPGRGRDEWITSEDIRGAGAIADLADNIFIFHRNKKKEIEAVKQEPREKVMQMADAYLVVDKQRNGEWTGTISLWFHADSMQYVASAGDGPIPYYDQLAPKEM